MRGWEALKALEEGQKLRCKFWDNGRFAIMQDGVMLNEAGRVINSLVWESLFKGYEWEVVQEPHDITWAAEQMSLGKGVKRYVWHNIVMAEGTGALGSDGSVFHLNAADLLAEDWMLA